MLHFGIIMEYKPSLFREIQRTLPELFSSSCHSFSLDQLVHVSKDCTWYEGGQVARGPGRAASSALAPPPHELKPLEKDSTCSENEA